MKTLLVRAVTLALFFVAATAQAVSSVGQHYIERISQGGPGTVRDVAKSIQQTGMDEVEVLDALAERLWMDYQKPGGNQIDATSWAIVALGSSGNSRYQSVIKNIHTNTSFKKVKKHAQKALKSLKDGSVTQFQPGSVNLTKTDTAAKPAAKTQPAAKSKSSDKVSLAEIKVGMSMQEVDVLAGSPTSTNSHITGKAFIPFNFSGKDAHRTIYYYKGQGRVVFSNQSAYSGTYRVSDVILNSQEPGYP